MQKIIFTITLMLATFGVKSLEEVRVTRQVFGQSTNNYQPQQIVIPKPHQQEQCRWIQGVGNPINLLKVLIEIINKNLSS